MTYVISISHVNKYPLKSEPDDFIAALKVFSVKGLRYKDEILVIGHPGYLSCCLVAIGK